MTENLIYFLPQNISWDNNTPHCLNSVRRRRKRRAAKLRRCLVWVGLSIFADMANKRLAWSSQAVPLAGPSSQGSPSRAPRATDHNWGRRNARLQIRLGGFKSLPADLLGEGAAFSHGSGRWCAFHEIPRQAGRQAAGRRRFPITHYDHRENRRMGSLP